MTQNNIYQQIITGNRKKVEEIIATDISPCLQALGYALLFNVFEANRLLSSIDEEKLSGDERKYYLETRLYISWIKDEFNLVNIANEIYKEFPNSIYANQILGYHYKLSRKREEAYKHFQEYLQINPKNEQINFEVFSLAVVLKRRDEIKIYKTHIKALSKRLVILLGTNPVVQVLLCMFLAFLLFLSKNTIELELVIFLLVFIFFARSLKRQNLLYLRLFSMLLTVSSVFVFFQILLNLIN